MDHKAAISGMLFGYTHQATRGNWLHACLYRMLRTIHDAIQAGNAVPVWPDIIPQAYQIQLQGRTGLRNRLQAYINVFTNLQAAERQAVRQAFFRQNRIRGLLANSCNCATADQLPAGVRNALSRLLEEAYRLLSEYGIRDQQYRTIYSNLRHKVCPFCGLERLDAPGAPREDLDHYLPRSRYPFAAVNAKNLVPMGGRCNSAYKGTADLLWNGAVRRRAFFPYAHSGIAVSLANSQPFGGGAGGAHPQWDISFVPDSVEAQTWDCVFHIRERYVRDVLEPDYESWLQLFANFCKSATLEAADYAGLVDALDRFRRFNEDEGLYSCGFLKAAVFEVLMLHCRQGNQRLIDLLQDVVSGP
jgi:hypothetical protein